VKFETTEKKTGESGRSAPDAQQNILLIDACVRRESRTRRLAGCLLQSLGGRVQTLRLAEQNFPLLTEDALFDREQNAHSPLRAFAEQFQKADRIVVAAPYWDLSFPALLKAYLEQIAIPGLLFRYEDGRPVGLCRCSEAFYVTTAGGPILNDEYGYGYVRALFTGMFGIGEVRLLKAEGLDIEGADVQAILREAQAGIDALL